MATITKLPSGKFRAQVRKAGFYRNQTFRTKRDAKEWALQIEALSGRADGELVTSRVKVATMIDQYIAAGYRQVNSLK